MRRLLALLLVTLPWVVLSLTAAGGASYAVPGCSKPAPAKAMGRAQVVFTGVVRSSEPSGLYYVSTVEVDMVYKGEVTTTEVRVRTGTGRCGLGQLSVDERYVVMADADGDSWLAGRGSGTALATDLLLARVQEVLGAGTAPTVPVQEPVPPTYTLVGDESPPRLLRAVAPGVALALVGLLGLLVARRFR